MKQIKLITKEEARDLLDSIDSNSHYEPIGLFYRIETNEEGEDFFIGFDNRKGDCWVEEFETLAECISWLNGEFEISDRI